MHIATKIIIFITMKPSVLALFRKFSKKDLVKPAATKFAYAFIMLSNLLDECVYNGLRSLMVCREYMRKIVTKSQKEEELSAIVLSPFFWRNVKEIVILCTLILKFFRLTDREGATMGLIYELTDRMIEKISSLYCIDSTRLEEVKNSGIERWDTLHSPLYVASYVLHGIWREKSPQMDTEVYYGWMDVLERHTHSDVEKQGQLCDELDVFQSI
ncbi:hypothetical protein KP509_12G061800 [Ceratopteris richardii]|uniref:Uncharacterized protein n=1 Tax=Ceratopteris richardii TaxID=49495 RepID=A0A8T2TLL4_CERRI|nr:hypothetical protein KP509_12G061800 [Ceratopteris richardii]